MSNITANITTITTTSALQAQATQAQEFFTGGAFATMIIIVAIIIGALIIYGKIK